MWQSPTDCARTTSCCAGEAGETLNFKACDDCHRWSGVSRSGDRTFALPHREEAGRVLCDAVEAHLEVQMRASGAAGRANP